MVVSDGDLIAAEFFHRLASRCLVDFQTHGKCPGQFLPGRADPLHGVSLQFGYYEVRGTRYPWELHKDRLTDPRPFFQLARLRCLWVGLIDRLVSGFVLPGQFDPFLCEASRSLREVCSGRGWNNR